MGEYTMRRSEPLRNQQERPIVQMSVGAYERLHGKLIKLSAIESAARTLVNYLGPGNPMHTTEMETRPLRSLIKALRAYDGWEDDEVLYEDAVNDMRAMIKDLEDRDADL